MDLLILIAGEVSDADKRLVRQRAYEFEDTADGPVAFSPTLMSRSRFDHLRRRERRFARDIEVEGIPL